MATAVGREPPAGRYIFSASLSWSLFSDSHVILDPGHATHVVIPHQKVSSHSSLSQKELHLQGVSEEADWRKKNTRRLMIGSTAPICTYNECRGCKYKCRAEQIPVDGNDPINSSYHYRCMCHR
ncbi:hypothetical protein NE237_016031 [Protea cynaroides]|uniref:Stomagen C-terminal domain-containing protein n=1 Tax=Protea cynaroides TaxID=273540 RepID=A0A9Q0QRM6_9MAGN|nr:hypothetical protein NE237_016031 [Protea cynaroides]